MDVEHKRNLYRVIIGDDGVRLAEEDAALAADSRTKTGDVTAATRALSPHLPPSMKVEAYVALAAVADIDQQITEQEKKVATIIEAATINARAPLTAFTASTLASGLADLLRRTLEDVAQDAEQQLAAHLANHGMTLDGPEWIATGVAYAQGDDCPFCGQDSRTDHPRDRHSLLHWHPVAAQTRAVCSALGASRPRLSSDDSATPPLVLTMRLH